MVELVNPGVVGIENILLYVGDKNCRLTVIFSCAPASGDTKSPRADA